MTAETVDDSSAGPGVRFSRRGALSVATLDSPSNSNALSTSAIAALSAWYPSLARDPGIYAAAIRSGLAGIFCPGLGLVMPSAADPGATAAARSHLAAALRLVWLQECFSKPTVSLVDGDLAGIGLARALYGTHRVLGPAARLRFAEPALGPVSPGTTPALASLPAGLGTYLALTGIDIGPADALALGLATHALPATCFDPVETALADADPVDPVLDGRQDAVPPGPVFENRERIRRYFDTVTPSELVWRLSNPHAGDAAWAAETLRLVRRRSPLAVCLAHRAIRQAATLDIRDCLALDFRIASRFLASADAGAGVVVPDHDAAPAPHWQYATVEAVPVAVVDAYLAPLDTDELSLPSRADMQAARV